MISGICAFYPASEQGKREDSYLKSLSTLLTHLRLHVKMRNRYLQCCCRFK